MDIQWSGTPDKNEWGRDAELPERRANCPGCGEPFWLVGVTISTNADRVYAIIPCPACRAEYRVKL